MIKGISYSIKAAITKYYYWVECSLHFTNNSNSHSFGSWESLIGFLLDSLFMRAHSSDFWCPSMGEGAPWSLTVKETSKDKNIDPICEFSAVMAKYSLRGPIAQVTCLKDSFSTYEFGGNPSIQHIIEHL